jgi:hypothetical protein
MTQKYFFTIFQYGYKNAEFEADLKSIEKVGKKFPEKKTVGLETKVLKLL